MSSVWLLTHRNISPWNTSGTMLSDLRYCTPLTTSDQSTVAAFLGLALPPARSMPEVSRQKSRALLDRGYMPTYVKHGQKTEKFPRQSCHVRSFTSTGLYYSFVPFSPLPFYLFLSYPHLVLFRLSVLDNALNNPPP